MVVLSVARDHRRVLVIVCDATSRSLSRGPLQTPDGQLSFTPESLGRLRQFFGASIYITRLATAVAEKRLPCRKMGKLIRLELFSMQRFRKVMIHT